jgi:hypothetical protein
LTPLLSTNKPGCGGECLQSPLHGKSQVGGQRPKASPERKQETIPEKLSKKMTGGVAQVVEGLPSKELTSNYRITKNNNKKTPTITKQNHL